MSKKFVFFGTPYVAKDTLAFLVEKGYVPSLVVTSPDAPKGRGQKVEPCQTKTWALAQNMPVLSPQRLSPDVLEEIRSAKADYGIVVAYGKILPQPLIDIFPLGLINIHYSLLPKYRGASPVESALLAGETHTGVTIQTLVKELDAGDILAKEGVPISEEETTRELRPRLVSIGSELLVRILSSLEEGALRGVPQDHTQVTKCGKIAKEDGLLDLSGDHTLNWRKYRAYAESPGTYFFVERNGARIRVKIKTATVRDGVFVPLRVVPEGKKETDFETYMKT